MTPDNQRVRTRGAARPRNLAAGCAAVLVVLAALFLLGWFLRTETAPPPPDPVPPPEPVSRSVDAPADPPPWTDAVRLPAHPTPPPAL